ncbi:MAG: aspartate/glutamate racemase family protein [Rhodospirillaceae bacterium]
MSRSILLVNPNTTTAMTERMAGAAQTVMPDGVALLAKTVPYGAPSIEGYYDEVFAVPPLLEVVAEHQGQFDGVVVGCFDDTGVDALRCVTDRPVIGLCQAGMQAASVLANGFSVITTLSRSVPALEHLAEKYGFGRLCRRIRAAEVPVLDLEDPASPALSRIEVEIERALAEDRTEAILLGCAGMVDLTHSLSEKYGVPVIEGVTAAAAQVEALSRLGLKTAKTGGYATPRRKTFSGLFDRFSP